MNPPAIELVQSLCTLQPGRCLDLASGSGRHAVWLREQGWSVTAVDLALEDIGGVACIRADLERGEFPIIPGTWDLIVCWLYW
jgi:2-polyprenyl-3-methyl-5-hydroxy-6-metoxy-1,4-benzoquinol methylase